MGDTSAPIYDGKVLVLENIEKETSSSAPSPPADAGLDKHPSVSTVSVKNLLDLVKGGRYQVHPAAGSERQDRLERAEYAIFAAAYRDAELMQRMSESLDNDMKNVTNALLDIAPRVVQTEAAVDAGQLYDVGARERIREAVQLYAEARRAGKTVEEYTANHSLTGEAKDTTIYDERFIEQNRRSAKKIREYFNSLLDEIESYGDPNQLNFFGEEEEHDYKEALEGAIKRYERETGTELPRLGEWGAGSYEAAFGGDEGARAEDAVPDVPDQSPREDAGERQPVDGGRGDAEPVEPAEPEEPETVPWDASPLPPPPGTEKTAPREETPEETRQRDLERMARKREKEREIITNVYFTDEQKLTLYHGISKNNEGWDEYFGEGKKYRLSWAAGNKAMRRYTGMLQNEILSL